MKAITENMIPTVSIIMLTVNRHQYIDRAIESIRAQSFNNWELLVVHDSENELVKNKVLSFAKIDNRVRYYNRVLIGNIANAMNFGIKNSNGCFIAVLDDDDEWIGDDKLEKQISILQSNAEMVLVGGGAVVLNTEGKELMRYLKPLEDKNCRNNALISNPIIHSSVLFRRKDAIDVGLYDESLSGYQDWELWLKLMQIGKIMNVNDYLVRYRVWDGGGTSSQIRGNAISTMRIIEKHKRNYSKYLIAKMIGISYMGLSYLPKMYRQKLSKSLSLLKKSIFKLK